MKKCWQMNMLAIDCGRHTDVIHKHQPEVDFCMVVWGLSPIFRKPVFKFKVVLDNFLLDLHFVSILWYHQETNWEHSYTCIAVEFHHWEVIMLYPNNFSFDGCQTSSSYNSKDNNYLIKLLCFWTTHRQVLFPISLYWYIYIYIYIHTGNDSMFVQNMAHVWW